MAFWMPYAMEQPIDLTVNATPEHVPVQSRDFYYPSAPRFYPFHPEQVLMRNLSPSPPQLVPDESTMGFQFAPSSPGFEEPVQQRPFKLVTAAAPEHRSVLDTDPIYPSFRSAMLDAMRARNGGTLAVSNPRMRRTVRRTSLVVELDNPDYKEKRAKNNAAAKRSRDIRRQKEDELAIRAAFLQRRIDELEAAAAAPAPSSAPCLRCQGLYI